MRTFFDLIKSFIREITGDRGIELYNKIWNQIKVSEFDLAEELKLSINQTRHLLYRLHEYNLVSSIRKKDKEKGWYIYYWTFNYGHAKDLLLGLKEQRLASLRVKIQSLKDQEYYHCPRNCVILNVEEAMEYNFKCPECEQILIRQDNEKRIEQIYKEVQSLREDIKNLKNTKFIEETTNKVEQRELPDDEEDEKKPKRKPSKRKPRKKPTRKRKPKKRLTKKRKQTTRKKKPKRPRKSKKPKKIQRRAKKTKPRRRSRKKPNRKPKKRNKRK